MSFEGNAAMKLPEQPKENEEIIIEKSNEELLRELKKKQLDPAVGEMWTEEDRKKLLELEAETSGKKPLTEMEKAHLRELQKIQMNREFNEDELSLWKNLNERRNY